MVISQPAVVCLQAATHHTALRATEAGHRLRRIVPWGQRRPALHPIALSPSLADLGALTDHPVLSAVQADSDARLH